MTIRGLVATGSADDIRTFSGIPYHFLQAGRRQAFVHHGVALDWPKWWSRQRIFWNALSPARLEGPGGFLLRRQSLEGLWRTRRTSADVSEWISFFPLMPPPSQLHEPRTYYLDATLQQNFDEYGYRVGHRTRRNAIAREREAYQGADRIVCFTEWCARSVTGFYGIPSSRVCVIPPGANLDDAAVPPMTFWDGDLAPLRLGFIGVDWRRKGLISVLRAATLLSQRGHTVEVIVLGPDPSRLPSHPALRPLGFLNKTQELKRFVEVIRSVHFGCLLSRIDASPISLLECLRLGIPVIATDVGGIRELIPGDAGVVVPPRDAAEHAAEILHETLRNPDRYQALRSGAARASQHVTWKRAVDEFRHLFGAPPHPIT